MRLRAFIRHIYGFVFATRLAPVTSFELAAIEKLRATISHIESKSPKVDGEENWLANCRELRQNILKKDPRAFLTWDVLYKTMFISYESWIGKELSTLRKAHARLSEPKIGAPANYLFTGVSGNTIHQTYHCLNFQEMSGRAINSYDQIVEFGGGYGNLCRLILESNFKGNYTIVDFPEFLALQEFYLSVAFAKQWSTLSKRISFVSKIDSLKPKKNSLTLAFWSISESPYSVRSKFLSRVAKCDWFFGYQRAYFKLDNRTYFSKRALARGAYVERDFVPLGGHKYLFSTTGKMIKN